MPSERTTKREMGERVLTEARCEGFGMEMAPVQPMELSPRVQAWPRGGGRTTSSSERRNVLLMVAFPLTKRQSEPSAKRYEHLGQNWARHLRNRLPPEQPGSQRRANLRHGHGHGVEH